VIFKTAVFFADPGIRSYMWRISNIFPNMHFAWTQFFHSTFQTDHVHTLLFVGASFDVCCYHGTDTMRSDPMGSDPMGSDPMGSDTMGSDLME